MDKNSDFKILSVDLECTQCKKAESQNKSIPVRRIIEKLDSHFATNDLKSAQDLLEYWQKEAKTLRDLSGELSVVNEMLGLYRRTNNKGAALTSINRALELICYQSLENTISGATIILNAATTCKAVGDLERAASLYEKASAVYHRELKSDDLRLAALYNNYATTLTDLERFSEAEELYSKAVLLTGAKVEGLLDCAVSYVNLAHLFEKSEGLESEKIEKCLANAENVLNDSRIERNPYYAFVCEKCAPSFDYFGFFFFANELNERSKKIYEGT